MPQFEPVQGGGGGGQPTGEFSVQGGRVIDPVGLPYWGAGMNVATTIDINGNQSPYVFEGLPPSGDNDIWDGDANNGLFPGGGWNADTVWSPASAAYVTVPDRAYAFNGNYSASAASHGITQPGDHWFNKIMRINAVPRGGGDTPLPAESIPQYVAAVQQLIDLGITVLPDCHNQTGASIPLSAAFIADPSIAIGSMGGDQRIQDAIEFQDAMVAAFATNGAGGLTNAEKGYVWFSLPNEPWAGQRDTNYEDWVYTQVARIRAAGAQNIISIPLGVYGQELGAVADGAYDALMTRLENGGIAHNLVWEWHGYGADWGGPSPGSSGYTGTAGYVRLENHLLACLNGTPGGKQFPIVTGEYGEATPVGAGNAGPDAWNRGAVECLVRDDHGPRLAEKYSIFPIAWHGSGDTSFFMLYKLTYGPLVGDPNENNGLGTPAWDIFGTNNNRLTRFGLGHWSVSHDIWAKTT